MIYPLGKPAPATFPLYGGLRVINLNFLGVNYTGAIARLQYRTASTTTDWEATTHTMTIQVGQPTGADSRVVLDFTALESLLENSSRTVPLEYDLQVQQTGQPWRSMLRGGVYIDELANQGGYANYSSINITIDAGGNVLDITGINSGTFAQHQLPANTITVDRLGNGDYTTIGAAMTYLAGLGAGLRDTDNRWSVVVGAGTYTENVTVPSWVFLSAVTFRDTVIAGTVTLVDNASVEKVYILPPTNTVQSAVISTFTTNGGFVQWINDCIIWNDNSYDGPTVAVEVTGAGNANIVRIKGGWAYARNAASAVNVNARAIGVMTLPAMQGGLETLAWFVKTRSPNAPAINRGIFCWNRATSGQQSILLLNSQWESQRDTAPLWVLNDGAADVVEVGGLSSVLPGIAAGIVPGFAGASVIIRQNLEGTLPQTTVNTGETIPASARGSTRLYDASGGALTIILPTTPNTGDWLWTVKTDSSSNRVTIRVGATDFAWLSAQGDEVMWYYNGTAWIAFVVNLAPLVITHLVSGSGNARPPLAKYFEWINQAAGGGGGGGRRGAAASNRFGGGGGANGTLSRGRLSLAAVGNPATYDVSIGAAGGAGAAATVNDTNGGSGTAGGNSTLVIGTLATVNFGGQPGGGGTSAAGTAGGAATNPLAQISNSSGVAATVAANGGNGASVNNAMSQSGPCGASISSAEVTRNSGGVSGHMYPNLAAAAGIASGNAATPAVRQIDLGFDFLGVPSVGGGVAGSALKGGYGSGGAGGGASTNGTNSGAGAAGGDGIIRLMFEF